MKPKSNRLSRSFRWVERGTSMRKCKFCAKPTKNKSFCSIHCAKEYQKIVNYTPNEIDRILNVVARLMGGQLQSGILTEIGREVGKSRERVRQRAKALGWIMPHDLTQILTKNCWYCGKEFVVHGQAVFCSNNCSKKYHFYKYNLLKTCKFCKLGFLTLRGRSNSSGEKRGSLAVFCGKTCQGKWLAKHYGWATHGGIETKYPTAQKQLKKDFNGAFSVWEFATKYGYSSGASSYTALRRLIFQGRVKKVMGGYKIK